SSRVRESENSAIPKHRCRWLDHLLANKQSIHGPEKLADSRIGDAATFRTGLPQQGSVNAFSLRERGLDQIFGELLRGHSMRSDSFAKKSGAMSPPNP